jgi:hypothetical protein
MTGLAAAFAHYGVTAKNPRWSWSARSTDGKTVVITLWKDHFNYKSTPITYADFGDVNLEKWVNRPGNRERIENLKWARDHCDGLFKVVIAVAEDVMADPRRIAESYAQDRLLMRLTDFKEETGEFRAVMAAHT